MGFSWDLARALANDPQLPPPYVHQAVVKWVGPTLEGCSRGRALKRQPRSRTESAAQIMYGTSDPLVGYAYRRCFRSVAGTPDRIARAKRLITSSACGPSRCAPTTRSALLSTIDRKSVV